MLLLRLNQVLIFGRPTFSQFLDTEFNHPILLKCYWLSMAYLRLLTRPLVEYFSRINQNSGSLDTTATDLSANRPLSL